MSRVVLSDTFENVSNSKLLQYSQSSFKIPLTDFRVHRFSRFGFQTFHNIQFSLKISGRKKFLSYDYDIR